jgi:excisionase family DNA binding protein
VNKNDPVDKILYTPTEAAQALGISRSTIYVLLASGEIPSVRIGSCRRVPVDGLRRYVAALAKRNGAFATRNASTETEPRLWTKVSRHTLAVLSTAVTYVGATITGRLRGAGRARRPVLSRPF